MTTDKLIKIRIDEDGKAEIETTGFKGGECKAATESIKKMYQNSTDTNTQEFYQTEAAPAAVVRLSN